MRRSVSVRARRASLAVGRLGAVVGLAAFTQSCDINQVLEDLFGIQLEPNLTGQNAYVHLERSNTAAATDVEGMLAMLAWQEEESVAQKADGEPSLLTEDVVRPARAGARLRAAIRPENFEIFAIDDLAGQEGQPKAIFDPVDLNSLQSEYTIPHLEAIPIRNQANRGTCAAFAGVGAVEYAALRQNPSLGTLDLSEQRFYYTSKPECQSNGCTQSAAGSWYGDGFDASLAASTFDIPLESDCPYNGNQTNNELQTPQAAGCSDGAAQVLDLQVVIQPNEIIAQLEAGFPVPFASPLSDNFFQNDGLITLADAGPAGDAMHAGGHAYLLVGYRKLPSMADEGGMCFIIKNSWGTGWGVNGFACATLAWLQEYHFGYALEHPVVVSVDLRDDIDGGNNGGGDDVPPDWADDDTYDDDTIDYDRLDDDEVVPDPTPVPDGLVWTARTFTGPAGEAYTAETASDGQTLHIRGKVRGSGQYTGTLAVTQNGSSLVYDGDVVGRLDGNALVLCTSEFDPVCSLRFEPTRNALYIEFLYPEYRAVRATELPDGDWQELAPIPGLGLGMEMRRPDNLASALLSPLYVRMTDVTGAPTDPVRLTLNGLDIQAMGTTIGTLEPSRIGLCSGNFADRCNVFTNGQQLLFIPNW